MIGVFDSGVGGLSVLKELKKISPNLDIVYFGDIKNAPYGLKDQSELKKLTQRSIKILQQNGVKNIFSACNSVSVFMLFSEKRNFKVMEMISPIVSGIGGDKKINKNKIAIFATPATIHSKIYQKQFLKIGLNIETFSYPELAGAIEFGANSDEIENIIRKNIFNQNIGDINNVILCCTHYPFVKDIFQKVFDDIGIKAEIIDPSNIVARNISQKFKENGSGMLTFLISKDSKNFREMVGKYFKGYDFDIKIV